MYSVSRIYDHLPLLKPSIVGELNLDSGGGLNPGDHVKIVGCQAKVVVIGPGDM